MVETKKHSPIKILERYSGSVKRNAILAAILVFILLLGFIFMDALGIPWLQSKAAHFWLEVIGFLLAVLAGFAALRQLKITQSSLYLFISLAFFANGIEDIIHAFAAIATFGTPTAGQSVFIPATWIIGRTILAALFLIAFYKKPTKIVNAIADNSVVSYLAPIVMFVLAFTSFALLFPVPDFSIFPKDPEFLHRPYEMLSLVLLLIAVPLSFSRLRERGSTGSLLMLSLITGIFVEIYILYSGAIFDGFFNWAHILKNASYFLFALSFMTKDKSPETFQSNFRLSIRKKLFLGFGALTLVAITLVITAFALEKGYTAHEVGRYVGFLAVVTIIFGILYPLRLVKEMGGSLNLLNKSAKEIAKGKLNLIINPALRKSGNEIGELAQTFDEMRIGLKDRNELLNSMLNAFKGKFGNIASILMRRNIQSLSKKNPRIMSILPKAITRTIKKEEELKKWGENEDARNQKRKTD